jgi:nitrite transporter NirC
MAVRIKSETARILMIWWCMFTFITSGYEHSVANMCGLMLGLLLPHGSEISLNGYAYNLALSTLGNIIGGAVFVAGLYYVGSPRVRHKAEPAVDSNGVAVQPELVGSR